MSFAPSRPLKKYIKTVSVYPERCTREEDAQIMPDFLDSEKVRERERKEIVANIA